jgi:hypothetical protein
MDGETRDPEDHIVERSASFVNPPGGQPSALPPWSKVQGVRVATLDLPNLIVGGLLGGFVGYGANRLQQVVERPRVKRYGFLKRTPQYKDGDMYKVWFILGGRRGPGSSSMEITYREPGVAPVSSFAKFDEAAIPYAPDGTYWPHMVPLTYQQVLHIGRVYTVPLVHSSDAGLYMFNGWWYGREAEHYTESVFEIGAVGAIDIELTGESLRWCKTIRVADLMKKAPSAALADSGDKQATVMDFVRTQRTTRHW